ncbi:MAG: hypothetical protein RLO51_19115 [Thalassobaculum sp.]|uniref:hypothetical protein n=1 Tax=Thalassobaculum sp. TaxID=2022740 RepID=UPI0032EC0A2C
MRGINLPQTFERRGTAVPFHQKDLAHARVREYFHGEDRLLEAVIPNYSGARRGELVVVPWEQVTQLASLDLRDQRVHEQVLRTVTVRDLDPVNIRDICLKADAALSGDPAIQEAAQRAAQRDAEDKAMVRLSFIAQLTRECGIAKGDQLMARTNTRTLMDLMGGDSGRTRIDLDLLIERVMIFAAERGKCTVSDAKSYLDPLVGMITPFGNVTAKGEEKSNGFLYLQHTRLLNFRSEVTAYRSQVREELDRQVELIVEAADECIGYVNERLSQLNELMGKLADLFDQNLAAIDRLERLRRDIAYGLDGWDDMISVWRDAYVARDAIGGSRAVERAIHRISGYAPRIPVRELFPDHEQVKSGSRYEQARVRMVSQMHSWENDRLDSELQTRVEEGRKRRPHTRFVQMNNEDDDRPPEKSD